MSAETIRSAHWRLWALDVLKLIGLFCLCLAAVEAVWYFQFWLAGVKVSQWTGDYFTEADWGLIQMVHGHVFALYVTPPAPRGAPLMMPLSLLLRAIALAVGSSIHLITLHSRVRLSAHSLGWSHTQSSDWARYQLGAVVTLAFGVTIVVATMWRRAVRSDRIAAVVLGVAVLLVPLAGSTLVFGHPEEFLMGALIIAAILAASRGLWTWAAVAFGLAVATKQPAWLLIPTFPLLLPPGQRRRGLAVAAGVAIIIICPFLLPHASLLISQQTSQVGASAPKTLAELSNNVWGLLRPLGLASLNNLGRVITILLAVVLPLMVGARNQWRLTVAQAAAIMALVLLARSFFDPFNIVYYEFPAVAALLALETHAWRSSVHPFTNRRALARLRPFPLLSLLAGILLWGVAKGFIAEWFGTLRVAQITYPAMYVLVNIVIAGPLALVVAAKHVKLDRLRVRLYGGLILAALVLLFVLSIARNGQSRDHLQAPPPAGMVAAVPGVVAKMLAPTHTAYWFGPAGLPAGRYLRTSAYTPRAAKEVLIRAFFDYATSSTALDDVAVFTLNGIVPGYLSTQIRVCAHPNSRCEPSHARDMMTPFGEALVTLTPTQKVGVQWEVRIPDGNETIDVLSSTKLPIAATIDRLQAVRVGGASASASTAKVTSAT